MGKGAGRGSPRTGGDRLGRLGEAVVAHRLRKLGYRILARRYRTRRGEIDLVAARDGGLIAVEVKTRQQRWRQRYGPPEAMLGAAQLGRLQAALLQHPAARRATFLRVDLAAVLCEGEKIVEIFFLHGIA